MAKKYESVRIFKSDLLEKFTHVHPITPLVMWVPFISWLLWRCFAIHGMDPIKVGIACVAGFVIWTLTEYTLHRYVFHFTPHGKAQEFLVYLIHGNHHEDPNDPTRLVMPPFPAIVLALILYGIFRLFLGAVWVEPFFAAFLVGYLCYDYTHFSIHHFRPQTKFGKFVKQHHMAHHFVSHDSRWGVSSPLWDYVFGTLEEKKQQKPHGT